MNESPINLYDLSQNDLNAFMAELGQPPFRARQIFHQLYVNLADSIGAMTDLPVSLREELSRKSRLGSLTLKQVQCGDGGLTRKALFELPGKEFIETVIMVYPGRATVCVSSQAGCPMGCVFCATAKLGFMQDLTSGQMLEQVIWARREVRKIAADPKTETDLGAPVKRSELPADLGNIVFMGMGEPFNNFDAWWKAVQGLHNPKGLNFGARSMTVSTVGLVPGIEKLAAADLQINLAISLHASDDDLRSRMMPVNKAYPIEVLLEGTRKYVESTGRRVSFEYVLISGKNDSPEEAQKLGCLLAQGPMKYRRSLMHVNLIPLNPVHGTPLERSSRNRVTAFQKILQEAGVPCTVRQERGVDIDAACGQLAGLAE